MENVSENIANLISVLRENKLVDESQLEDLQQKFQDAEDFFLTDKITAFKAAYENGEMRRCVFLLCRIAVEDYLSEKHGIRKLLYRDHQILPNPLNHSVRDDDIKKVKQILLSAIDHFNRRDESETGEGAGKSVYTPVKEQLIQLFLFYEAEYDNHKMNEKTLIEQQYLNYSLAEIFRSMLVFYQDQVRLARRELKSKWKTQPFVTGMEGRVSDRASDMYPDVKVAMDDNFEQRIEEIDALFRYV